MKYQEILDRAKGHPMMGGSFLNWSDTSRESYLAFVVSEGVATEEEQAEYRGLHREAVLAKWDEHAKKAEEVAQKKIEDARKNIEFHKGQAKKLRRIGEYDFAVKREEYILYLERALAEVGHRPSDGHFIYRSLRDWGDDEIREWFSTERTGKAKIDTVAA